MIYSNDASVTISSSEFYNNTAILGGVYEIIGESSLSITSSIFDTNVAIEEGGIGYLIDSVTSSGGSCTFDVTNTTFTTQYSGKVGGAFFLKSN